MRTVRTLVLDKLVNHNDTSLATRTRRQRFQFFLQLLDKVPKPASILDVGGSQEFWELMKFVNRQDVHITLLNLHSEQVKYNGFTSLQGDATDMSQFKDGHFDIAFSNSVIEHVGDCAKQKSMAHEMQRVGKKYFLQTPNYWFPMEVHFLIPGFQWLPVSVRTLLIRNFDLGGYKKIPDPTKAMEFIDSTRLLKRSELQGLFSGGDIRMDRILGLANSITIYSREW